MRNPPAMPVGCFIAMRWAGFYVSVVLGTRPLRGFLRGCAEKSVSFSSPGKGAGLSGASPVARGGAMLLASGPGLPGISSGGVLRCAVMGRSGLNEGGGVNSDGR